MPRLSILTGAERVFREGGEGTPTLKGYQAPLQGIGGSRPRYVVTRFKIVQLNNVLESKSFQKLRFFAENLHFP